MTHLLQNDTDSFDLALTSSGCSLMRFMICCFLLLPGFHCIGDMIDPDSPEWNDQRSKLIYWQLGRSQMPEWLLHIKKTSHKCVHFGGQVLGAGNWEGPLKHFCKISCHDQAKWWCVFPALLRIPPTLRVLPQVGTYFTLGHSSHTISWVIWKRPGPSCVVLISCLQLHFLLPGASLAMGLLRTTCATKQF